MKNNLKHLDFINEAVKNNVQGYNFKHAQYRKKYQNNKINVGDKVLIRNFLPDCQNNVKFKKDFLVIGKVGNTAFLVESIDKKTRFIRHYNDLKKQSKCNTTNKSQITSLWSKQSRKVCVGSERENSVTKRYPSRQRQAPQRFGVIPY